MLVVKLYFPIPYSNNDQTGIKNEINHNDMMKFSFKQIWIQKFLTFATDLRSVILADACTKMYVLAIALPVYDNYFTIYKIDLKLEKKYWFQHYGLQWPKGFETQSHPITLSDWESLELDMLGWIYF